MDAGIAGLIGAAIGAVAGVGGSIASTLIASRSEEHRHYRALGVQVATAKFEQHVALAKQVATLKGGVVFTPSFESFLVYGIRLMDVVSDLTLSPDEIKARVAVLAKSIANEGAQK
jgi:hypothetical protein